MLDVMWAAIAAWFGWNVLAPLLFIMVLFGGTFLGSFVFVVVWALIQRWRDRRGNGKVTHA